MNEDKFSESEPLSALSLLEFKLVLAQYKRAVYEQIHLQELVTAGRAVCPPGECWRDMVL